MDFLPWLLVFPCVLFVAFGSLCSLPCVPVQFCLMIAILAFLMVVWAAAALIIGSPPAVKPMNYMMARKHRPPRPRVGVPSFLYAVLWICLSCRIGEARKPGPEWTVSVANLSGLNTRAFGFGQSLRCVDVF